METFQEIVILLLMEMTKFHSIALVDTDQLQFANEIERLTTNLVLCFWGKQDDNSPEDCFEKINTSVKNISRIIKSFLYGGN